VAPGSYTLQVMMPGAALRRVFNGAAGAEPATPEMAYLPSWLAATTSPASRSPPHAVLTVNGTLVADQGTGQLAMTGITVMAQPLRPQVGAGQRAARVGSDGTFSLAGVIGPQVLRIEGVPRDWMVSRVEMNGADVTDTPIDFKGTERVAARVVLTNRVPELSGTVKAAQESSTGYQVVVFPADASKWTFTSRYLKTTRAAADGTFDIRALPPKRALPGRGVGLPRRGRGHGSGIPRAHQTLGHLVLPTRRRDEDARPQARRTQLDQPATCAADRMVPIDEHPITAARNHRLPAARVALPITGA
jgi:hypothetical protein